MLELVIANKNYSSWSLRPWVLMRQLGIPFSETLVPFPGGDSHATYKPLSPNARVPCLVDGDLRVWDSLAIVEYLAERHPGVWPADATARAFARSAAAEMHSSFATLRDVCTMNCGLRIRLHERPAALERDVARLGEIWTEGLARFGGPFLAGSAFTALDAFYAPVAFRAQTYGLSFGAEADAWAARVLALPAMQDWYQAALAETFREDRHEAEARAVGDWTQDLRATA